MNTYPPAALLVRRNFERCSRHVLSYHIREKTGTQDAPLRKLSTQTRPGAAYPPGSTSTSDTFSRHEDQSNQEETLSHIRQGTFSIRRMARQQSRLPQPESSVSSASGSPRQSVFTPSRKLVDKVDVQRQNTLRRVEQAIQSDFGSQYSVKAFGSTEYGVDHFNSDLDLILLDSERPTGFAPDVDLKQLPPIYNVRKVAKSIRKRGMKVLEIRPTAAVPIIKFADSRNDITCDMNVNDRLGLINTMLIGHYCDLLPVLRPLLRTIKTWAKRHDLNNPSDSGKAPTFSSYSLALMTIGFFQVRGLLPNLQDLEATSSIAESDQTIFWIRTKTNERIACDTRWWKADEVSNGWSVRRGSTSWNRGSLVGHEESFYGWLEYWAREFSYEKEVMSIRHGGVIPRTYPGLPEPPASGLDSPARVKGSTDDGKSWTPPSLWQTQPFVIADPFIKDKNTAAAIKLFVIDKFRECCNLTLEHRRSPSFPFRISSQVILSKSFPSDHEDMLRRRRMSDTPE